MINIAVCDDEGYFLEELSERIAKFFSLKGIEITVKKFASGQSLIAFNNALDIIFLDVKMENTNGFEAAQELRSRGFSGYIVFVTSLKEAVYDSFEFGAFDYLVKPLSDQNFEKTLNRLYNSLKDQTRQLLIKRKNDWRVARFSEILYCEAVNRKIYVHLANGSIINFYEKIDEISEKLDKSFFRCHRSYLVNLEHCKGCGSGMILLDDGEKIPVSRLRSEKLLQSLAEYIGGGN